MHTCQRLFSRLQDRVRDAMEVYKKALKIYHSEKLEKRIQKMQKYLDENPEEEDEAGGEDEMVKNYGLSIGPCGLTAG